MAPGPGSRKAIVVKTSTGRRVKRDRGRRRVPRRCRLAIGGGAHLHRQPPSGSVSFASAYTYRKLRGSLKVARRLVSMAVQPGYSLIVGTPGS